MGRYLLPFCFLSPQLKMLWVYGYVFAAHFAHLLQRKLAWGPRPRVRQGPGVFLFQIDLIFTFLPSIPQLPPGLSPKWEHFQLVTCFLAVTSQGLPEHFCCFSHLRWQISYHVFCEGRHFWGGAQLCVNKMGAERFTQVPDPTYLPSYCAKATQSHLPVAEIWKTQEESGWNDT